MLPSVCIYPHSWPSSNLLGPKGMANNFVICLAVQMLPEDGVPPVSGTGQLMVPPAPILKDDNWPLLTVSKGFFETLAAKGAAAAGSGAAAAGAAGGAAAAAAAVAAGTIDEGELEGAGWGDDLDIGGDGGAAAADEGDGFPGKGTRRVNALFNTCILCSGFMCLT